jgi:Flp pilus assembly protein TadD
MPKAPRFAPYFALTALLLGCTALSGSANAGWFDSSSKPEGVKDAKPAPVSPAASLEESVSQAQALRLAGSYPEAIRHLSQLMMVASDDSRVISEYGKTLAAMGRSQDAVNFLTRAQQLQPGDWTIYSAMGVAYDQLGDQKSAQAAYEHALQIKPGEPSLLNNYALSRMLAKDPEMARKLAGRAEIAGGTSDPKIARNIAMIRAMAPEAPDASLAVKTPAPSPAPQTTMAVQQTAPLTPVTASALPQPLHITPAAAPVTVQAASTAPKPTIPVASNVASITAQAASTASKPATPTASNPAPVTTPAAAAPFKPVAPMASYTAPTPVSNNGSNAVINAQAQASQAPHDNRVVMQRVPLDPLAGPVHPADKAGSVALAASHAPRPLQPQTAANKPVTAKTGADDMSTVRAEAPKPAPLPAPGAKSAAAQAQDLQAKADVLAKQLTNKPAAIAAAKTEANKEVAVKTETNKAVVAKAEANKPAAPVVKTAETKPTPKGLEPAVKVAETKPVAITTAKMEANKDVAARIEANKPAGSTAKTAETKPGAVSKALDPKALQPVNAADTKRAPMPKVLDPKPTAPVVKTAETKPAVLPPAPVKAAAAPAAKDAPKAVAAKSKDSIPGLRMSANAY